MLVRSERDGAARARRRTASTGSTTGAVEGEDPLAPFGPNAADHVRRTDAFPHCPDIVVNSTLLGRPDEVAAFEELVGSHGGLGGGQASVRARPAELPGPTRRSSAPRPSTGSSGAGSPGSARTPTRTTARPARELRARSSRPARAAPPGRRATARRPDRRSATGAREHRSARIAIRRRSPQWIGIATRGSISPTASAASSGSMCPAGSRGPQPETGSIAASIPAQSAMPSKTSVSPAKYTEPDGPRTM